MPPWTRCSPGAGRWSGSAASSPQASASVPGARPTAPRASPPVPCAACSRPSRPKGPTTSRERSSAGTSPRDGPASRSRCGRRSSTPRRASRSKRRRGHLARGRRRRLLRLRSRRREPDVHARHPAHERRRAGALPDRLPGLVSGPDRAHPREGARRRKRRPHGAALLPRLVHGRRLQEVAVHEEAVDATRGTATTSSTRTAARTRC